MAWLPLLPRSTWPFPFFWSVGLAKRQKEKQKTNSEHRGRRAGRDCRVIELVSFIGPIPSLRMHRRAKWLASRTGLHGYRVSFVHRTHPVPTDARLGGDACIFS